MSEVDDFLSAVVPQQRSADMAMLNGDSGLRKTLWSHKDPVTVLGAAKTVSGWSAAAPRGETYHRPVRRILITGMSGAGKSSVIRALAARGLKAIDTDWNPEWECVGANPNEWVWREDRIRSLLAKEDGDALFVSACVSNQGKFYDRFDEVILLSAPESITVQRLANRTGNPYGKRPEEIADVLRYKATVEPMLREAASAEIDTSVPLAEVVSKVLEISLQKH